jgi:hypothetical protein
VALPAPLPGSLESIGVFIFWVPQSYDPRDSLLRAKPPRTHARGEKATPSTIAGTAAVRPFSSRQTSRYASFCSGLDCRRPSSRKLACVTAIPGFAPVTDAAGRPLQRVTRGG